MKPMIAWRVDASTIDLYAPGAVLEDEVELLTARAGDRGRNQRGGGGSFEGPADLPDAVRVVLDHPAECLERDPPPRLVRQKTVGVVRAALLESQGVGVKDRLRVVVRVLSCRARRDAGDGPPRRERSRCATHTRPHPRPPHSTA